MDEKQKALLEELLVSSEELPSFAKMLFFGVSRGEALFPYPRVPSKEEKDVEMLLKELDCLSSGPLDGAKIDRDEEIPKKLLQRLSELKIMGMTVGKEWGGMEMSQHAYCKVMERIARECASTVLFINAHHSIGLRGVLLFGTDEQQETYLKDLSTGKIWGAFALTEPGAGSDAGGIEAKAEYLPEKRAYCINGEKQWITNGSIAGLLTVMAKVKVGDEEKVTAFLVTPKMKGFSIKEKALEKVGMRGTKTSILRFDNVMVPEENVLGPIGKGLRIALTILDYGRVTFGATCLGTAKFCLEKAVVHAKEREQFGRPLASFTLVKKKLAEASAKIYAMEAMTYLLAGLLDKREEDIMLEAAILKVFNSEAGWDILYDTMQIFGGRSFFTDHPFERIMRDSRLNMIGEGSNDVLKAFIAVVGLREVGLSLDAVRKEPSSFFKWVKGQLKRLSVEVPAFAKGELRPFAKRYAKDVRRFATANLRLLMKYREEVVEQQLELERVTTMVISLFARAAVLSRLASQEGDLEAGHLFLELSQKEFDEAHASLGKSALDQKVEVHSDHLVERG